MGIMGEKHTQKNAVALDDQELAALTDTEATLVAAPWLVWDDGDIGTAYPVTEHHRNRATGSVEPTEVESLWLFNGSAPTSEQLVAIRNLLPGLLVRLRDAEARIKELEVEVELVATPF